MMKYFAAIVLLASQALVPTQAKPAVDLSAMSQWPSVVSSGISPDGRYAYYVISTLAYGDDNPIQSSLVLRATEGAWQIRLPGLWRLTFTRDSRKAIFTQKDSLCLRTLGTATEECIPQVDSFALIQHSGDEWLVYQLKNTARELILRNLTTGDLRSFAGVMGHLFSKDHGTLLLHTESKEDEAVTQTLHWMDFPRGQPRTIWQGAQASQFVFDASGNQLAFTVQERVADQTVNAFWHYTRDAPRAVLVVDKRTADIEPGLQLGTIQRFSHDGRRLFFSLTTSPADPPAPNPQVARVDVWSYTDSKLQSEQLLQPAGGAAHYTAALQLRGRAIVRLQGHNEEIRLPESGNDDVALIVHSMGNAHEAYWNRAARPTYYVVSTKSGKRQQIDGGDDPRRIFFSPTGRYLIRHDKATGDCFSYEIATGIVRNFTKSLPVPPDENYDPAWPMAGPRGLSDAGFWLANDQGYLLYDKYDLWLVDPAGKTPPINVTLGYGRRHHLILRSAENRYGLIRKGDTLLLGAFDERTKERGLFTMVLGQTGDPQPLIAPGPYTYDFGPKARDAQVYLIKRESAAESPNYFVTRDFRALSPLSEVYPERAYNWLHAELITWKTFDGKTAQGVLYKPEDFDPQKKYPLILHYYELKSDALNHYDRPAPMDGGLPIPLFVSNGYLVFTPDIRYTWGEPGPSAYDFVVSGAEYLMQFPWVDRQHMGLQGHSFGGYEALYLITHSNRFAAAMASSAVGNLISYYGDVLPESGEPVLKHWIEEAQGRIGATLWQRPELYIENSPIFRAHQVSTPLLMMNNKKDGGVPFNQGVEFFTALRRLGKPVWMLQYDGEGHGLNPLANKSIAVFDCTKRVLQFFDHYLKGAPAPKWMTQGIPARLKGIEAGFELDTRGKSPGSGLVQRNYNY